MSSSLGAALLFFILLLFHVAIAIPKHQPNDQIDVYVNKVGPSANPHESYHYYKMPFCRPEKIVHKSLSLGQVMEGDRMAESSFVIKFGQNQPKTSLCGPRNLTQEDVSQLIQAIEREYYFELFIDDIKVRQKMGIVEEKNVFPHVHKIYLFTTINFFIKANKETILEVEIYMADRKELEEKTTISLDLQYTVKWNVTEQPNSDRKIVLENRFPRKAHQVHGLTIIASGTSILLILTCILGVIGNMVHKDVSGRIIPQDEIFSETGWKVIATEVFRGPTWPNLHCAAIGVGFQFCLIMLTLVIFGITGILDVHYHGSLNTVSVVLYSITSIFAGYMSASKFAQLGGKSWVSNINVTSILYSAPMMIIWALNNTIFWSYQTTRALPWTTVVVLLSMWVVFGYPLAVIGGIIGRHFGIAYNAPCRSRLIPREIPNNGLLSSPLLACILGGLVPYASIIMEMPYVFQILWGRAHLEVDLLVLVTLVFMISTVACNSIALTYVQLNNEDYRWWWRSFFQGASIGVFIFGYGLYFLFYQSQMTGFVQLFEFFSHLFLLCYIVSLACGAVAHLASRGFVWYLYNSMKTD